MRPYIKYQDRDAAHPNGKPTPKQARCRAGKKAARQQGKSEVEAQSADPVRSSGELEDQ